MDLQLVVKEEFLLATVNGQVRLQDALEFFQRACDTAAELGLDRVLVDCSTAEGELTDLERYELGCAMAAYHLTKSIAFKVATVGRPPLISGFAAQVAFNRGVTAATFPDLQKATEWLRHFGSGTIQQPTP